MTWAWVIFVIGCTLVSAVLHVRSFRWVVRRLDRADARLDELKEDVDALYEEEPAEPEPQPVVPTVGPQ